MAARVLMVDDEQDNRQIVHDLLVHAGYEVVVAVDAEEGMALASTCAPDLIIMDIQLPGIDVYEATRRIKANPDLAHIPVIALTSYALKGDEAKALEAGCEVYIIKPFSPRKLLDKIQEFVTTGPHG